MLTRSVNGQYLASGSDDTKIVIWTRDTSNLRNVSFGANIKNIESYRPVKVLMSHESGTFFFNFDVADLAWSLDSRFLASVGLDSKIYIWDAVNFGFFY